MPGDARAAAHLGQRHLELLVGAEQPVGAPMRAASPSAAVRSCPVSQTSSTRQCAPCARARAGRAPRVLRDHAQPDAGQAPAASTMREADSERSGGGEEDRGHG